MNTMKTKLHPAHRVAHLLLGAGALLASGLALAVNDLPGGPAVNEIDLQPAVTSIADQQQWLHNMMLLICLVIFVAVFGVMFYSILKHRKSLGHKPAHFHESTAVEIAWTLVPFLIVVFMGAMATRTVVASKDTSGADLTIKVTGYQWKWGYDYLKGPGEGIHFLSTLDVAQREASEAGKPSGDDYLLKVDNALVVPVDRKVRIITTADDVIHAWSVPAFGVQQDAIPGFVRDTWFRAEKLGDYYGQCDKLCGKEHSYMPIHVRVVSQDDYAKWVDVKNKEMAALLDDPNKVWTQADLIARGEKVYNANCAVCHKPDGKGGGPIKALDGSPTVLSVDKSQQIVTVLNGRLNGAMPSWKALSDTDLAAVITYTKNNWSNHTGQIVQPSEVAAVRAGKALAPMADAAPAAPAAAAGLPASILFASGVATLDATAQETMKSVLDFLKSHGDAKVALSGFVDNTGDPAKNAELAKERAKAVRGALTAGGVAADRIEMRKPGQINAGAADKDAARRVDIVSAG
ncbi:MAG: cytochrome c oxidase subunit II [Burkholderiales bacterium]|nr:cytochrome c oxidase subunit II [Burkholderiales bacterium]